MVIGVLVSTVMSILLPYVSKSAEEFAKEAGKAAFEKAKGLMTAIKAKVSGNADGAEVLSLFEKTPELYKPALEGFLQKILNEDPVFHSELSRLLEAIGPDLVVIQKLEVGKNVVGAEIDEFDRGKVTVHQDADHAERITGAKIKKFGTT